MAAPTYIIRWARLHSPAPSSESKSQAQQPLQRQEQQRVPWPDHERVGAGGAASAQRAQTDAHSRGTRLGGCRGARAGACSGCCSPKRPCHIQAQGTGTAYHPCAHACES